MKEFKALLDRLDEEARIEPLKVGKIESIRSKFDKQLKKINKFSLNMAKGDLNDRELEDLLEETSGITADAARKRKDDFT